ncbi:MAG TPA: di-trans,poly-cis-decaprenylcistransferase [Chloroflexota bacterium]|nr:di-trans,poly-cis-decaprenylcistransferase [Chloroflexota bacterium]
MLKSTLPASPGDLHVAIIMDGNGRWALARGRSRSAGHRAGARAVRPIIEAAPSLGIGTLTLYMFSADNWRRPTHEVHTLMRLFRVYLRSETDECVRQGVRLSVIGRRADLPAPLRAAIEEAEAATAGGRTLHLRLAVNYSARDAILRAACRVEADLEPSFETFRRLLAEVDCDSAPVRDVDLLIRTGGEQRLSDFLLWECAYAELVFLPRMWPDFTAENLAGAVREFQRRERRFGTVPALLAAVPAEPMRSAR